VARLRLQIVSRAAAALLLAASLVAEPAAALAAPATSPSVQAQKKAALAEIEQMKVEFAKRVDEYVEINRRIEEMQVEIAEVNKQVDAQDETLEGMKAKLADRAAQLYRTDPLDILNILLGAQSTVDLVNRISFLVWATQQDTRVITDATKAKRESEWMQNHLNDRMTELQQLQAEADTRRARIERMIAFRQEQVRKLGSGIQPIPRSRGGSLVAAGDLPATQFDPTTIMSDSSFRDVTGSAAEIQAFLNQQPGSLKSYRGRDHNGVTKSAAEMIADAAAAWNVSPKVILVTLQKEQSLLARANPSGTAMDWALGVGKTDSSTLYRYKGFGNQIWYGAATLNNNAERWKPGAQLTIDGNYLTPSNGATHSLYRYTPHIRGNTSFWMLYWRYFGDPRA
jgi:hypothetical protein